jgi:DNA-binding IclR family transcriptional regulator
VTEREGYLRRRNAEEADLVDKFLAEYQEIKSTRIATNVRETGTRFAIATTVRNQSGEALAAITLVGPTADVRPRVKELGQLLLRHVDSWPQRSMTAREPI